jgi:hypothetical protein
MPNQIESNKMQCSCGWWPGVRSKNVLHQTNFNFLKMCSVRDFSNLIYYFIHKNFIYLMYRGFENLFNGSCVYKTLAGISDDINSVLTRRWTLFAQTEKPRLEKPNSGFFGRLL